VGLVAGCDGCQNGSTPAAAVNTHAAGTTEKAAQAYLLAYAKQHTDQQTAVQSIIDGWSTRPERDSYNLAKPILQKYAQENSTESQDVADLLSTWDKRLTSFNQ
jgi:hypothetical protein